MRNNVSEPLDLARAGRVFAKRNVKTLPIYLKVVSRIRDII
jgi:hypothetical protein